MNFLDKEIKKITITLLKINIELFWTIYEFSLHNEQIYLK